jgi:hypothetical protein
VERARDRGVEVERYAHRDEKGSLGESYKTTIPLSPVRPILGGTVDAGPTSR